MRYTGETAAVKSFAPKRCRRYILLRWDGELRPIRLSRQHGLFALGLLIVACTTWALSRLGDGLKSSLGIVHALKTNFVRRRTPHHHPVKPELLG